MFFFSSRRRHTRWPRDWSSDVCSSDLLCQAERKEKELRSQNTNVKSACGRTGIRRRSSIEVIRIYEGALREVCTLILSVRQQRQPHSYRQPLSLCLLSKEDERALEIHNFGLRLHASKNQQAIVSMTEDCLQSDSYNSHLRHSQYASA